MLLVAVLKIKSPQNVTQIIEGTEHRLGDFKIEKVAFKIFKKIDKY